MNLEPAPDAAKDPVWTVLERTPSDADLASPEAYLAYHKRSRPDLASIWCEAIEADKLEDMTIDGVRDPLAARARQRKIGPMVGSGKHSGLELIQSADVELDVTAPLRGVHELRAVGREGYIGLISQS